jgi:hypothetical protein
MDATETQLNIAIDYDDAESSSGLREQLILLVTLNCSYGGAGRGSSALSSSSVASLITDVCVAYVEEDTCARVQHQNPEPDIA